MAMGGICWESALGEARWGCRLSGLALGGGGRSPPRRSGGGDLDLFGAAGARRECRDSCLGG